MGIYDDLARLNEPSPGRTADPAREETEQPATSQPTLPRELPRRGSRRPSRQGSREERRDLPTREEIQTFSFRLRDELKVKVQAEVPHAWQKELEDLARDLDVKKLELYRFILGEFLGKVKRQSEP